MFSQPPSGVTPSGGAIDPNGPVGAVPPAAAAPAPSATGEGTAPEGSSIQQELDRLEEMVLDSPRVPFGKRTLVDEEQLLDQLDTIRLSLPAAFREAEAIVRQREQVLYQADRRAQDILDAARQEAARTVHETAIVQQAQMEAEAIRDRVQQECEAARNQTLAEIDQIREEATAELEEMRRTAIAECEAIQEGADDYADRVLGNIERQLGEMLRVIRNGRQQLQQQSLRASEANKKY
ncbi:MAG: DivIVA domain-containing protein [Cyanobacteria bacterium]|nr:DivIVA domain-containing protein [Cyanobacteriota bacterium]